MKRPTPYFFFAVAVLVVSGCQDASLSGARTARAQGASEPLVTRRIWAGDFVDATGSPSPDGRSLTLTDWRPPERGHLAIRDLASGEIRILAQGGGESGVFSPDGQRVVYSWFENNKSSVRVINVDGTGLRILSEQGGIRPRAWSPDGSQILVSATGTGAHQIALLSTTDGSLRVLKTLDWRSPTAMAFSPDGRDIAYDFPRKGNSPQRDLVILATDASRENVVVEHPADDRFFGWSNDGRALIFSSDRGTSPGIWSIEVAGGRAASQPKLLKSEMWRLGGSLGTDRSGRLYYSIRPTIADVFSVSIDPATGSVTAPPTPIATGSQRREIPAWSPDGRHIAYTTVATGFPSSGPGNFRIEVKSLDTGETRVLTPTLSYFASHVWFPDGEALLVRGADERGQHGMFRIDARTGTVTSLSRGIFQEATLSRDGKNAYYPARKGDGFAMMMARNLASDVERQLCRLPGNIGSGSESPDGSQVAFSIVDQSGSSIYVVPSTGGSPREVARLPKGHETGPFRNPVVWDRAGHLLFVMNEVSTETRWISRVAVTGGPIQKLDVQVANARFLSMHPDGRRLAFHGGEDSTEIWVMEPAQSKH